ncbi:hypothetical protein FXO38_19968 [Capsicum annuum]|nr:hypothetical protein FXO38_19968 [Capsicum annuum]
MDYAYSARVGDEFFYHSRSHSYNNRPNSGLLKKELAGATGIRRAVRQGQPYVEAFHDQPATKNLVSACGGVVGGVVNVGANHADEHVAYAQAKINLSETKINLLEFDDFLVTLSVVQLTSLQAHVLFANAKTTWTKRMNSSKK